MPVRHGTLHNYDDAETFILFDGGAIAKDAIIAVGKAQDRQTGVYVYMYGLPQPIIVPDLELEDIVKELA
jgi:hypothetical protein